MTIASHNIEEDLKSYIQNFHNTRVNASTLGRRWREFRNMDPKSDLWISAKVGEIKELNSGGRESTWEIYRANT